MRPLLLALVLLAVGCSSTPQGSPQPQVREIPLNEDEAWSWASLQHEIRAAQQAWLKRIVHAKSLDERTEFVPSRGVLIAPVTSAP